MDRKTATLLLVARTGAAMLAALLGCASLGAAQASAAGVRLSGLAPVLPARRTAAPVRPAEIRARKAADKAFSLTPSAVKPHWACPQSSCETLIDPAPALADLRGRRGFSLPGAGRLLEGAGVKGGLDPQDLQSAYKIPSSGGEDQTVAVVDAYGYSTAEADLATYRKQYGLPPCTKANGCFHKINQHGEEANYPPDEAGWDGEAALDIEMVSAACPDCHIIQAEGDTATTEDLDEAVEAAARDGATEISASYGSPESSCGEDEEECEEERLAYDQPGVMVFASAGDDGYNNVERAWESPNMPAALPSVVAVGGTNLFKADDARGWEDTVWSKGGSGCSSLIAKPPWQSDTGCAMRMSDDVAADASCQTPVSTYRTGEGWQLVCGTSASSPLVAGIEAHASAFARSLPGADAFYHDPSALFDVTSGSNGICTPPDADSYFCTAQAGYDGPTGNGVPDGPLELQSSAPSARTRAPQSVTASTAELEGSVDPQGEATSYRFEYGPSTEYGSSVPVGEGSLDAGQTTDVVSAEVEGLQPDRTYHYRLVASNATGSDVGSDTAFTTAAPTITASEPSNGPADGGTPVTITGTGFTAVSAVHFGVAPAASFEVTSEDSITAVSPYGQGTVDLSVTTAAGTSAPDGEASFTWASPGPVLGWGRDTHDTLGNGSRSGGVDVPVEARGLREAVQLSAGLLDSYAVTGSATVKAWGYNFLNGFGDGTDEESSLPAETCAVGAKAACPDGPFLSEVTQVASGFDFALALLKSGRVVSWGGSGKDGELGRPLAKDPYTDTISPGYVCTSSKGKSGECARGKYLEGVQAIAAGADFSLALLKDGTVVGWGDDTDDQLGAGAKGLKDCELALEERGRCADEPTVVAGLSEVTEIAAGNNNALARLANGTVKAWGEDAEGQLGNGTSETDSGATSVCAPGETAPCAHELEGVAQVSVAWSTSAALLATGDVVTWGWNGAGELGDGSFSGPQECMGEPCSTAPVAVENLAHVHTIASGVYDENFLALTDAGALFTWGLGENGDVGNGSHRAASVPTRVCAPFAAGPCPAGPYLEGEVAALAAGGFHDLVNMRHAQILVSGASPDLGPGRGGTTVTITGSGFEAVTQVYFGSTPATSFEVRSPTEIVAVSPPGSGTVEVRATAPGAESEPRLGEHYTYEESTLTGLTPDIGPAAGGTSVTITGTKFTGASAVHFGSAEASFEAVSPTEILAVAPPGSGSVQVSVTTPEGTTAASEVDRYTYQSPPTVITGELLPPYQRTIAEVDGRVDPNASKLTGCRFEYGLTSAYEHRTGCKGDTSAEGSTFVRLWAIFEGLRAATTYHFRIVAENAFGTGYGEDGTFTTVAKELPELGRCEALLAPSGSFGDKDCTIAAAANGAYEWAPGPGADAGFAGSSRSVVIEAGEGAITCTSGSLSGTYTGPWSATARLDLGGCDASGKIGEREVSGQCTSPGAEPGVIALPPLLAYLAWVKKGKTAGWDYAMEGVGLLSPFVFSCGSVEVQWYAGFIGMIGTLDAPASRETLHFSSKSGVTELGTENEQGTEKSVEAATVTARFAVTSEEPLEVKSTS